MSNYFTKQEKIRFKHVDYAGIVFYPRFFAMFNRAFDRLRDGYGGWLAWALERRALVSIGFVSLANSASIILLVHLLVNGELTHKSTAAAELLRAAVHMWVVNVLLFGLWYWQLDGGGPLSRPACLLTQRDFLFPQQTEPALAESGWHPEFLDYLYVSFTNAAAFSPTDTMPLTTRAKAMMGFQSTMALITSVVVIAKGVGSLR